MSTDSMTPKGAERDLATRADDLLDKVLAEFEKRTMAIPVGHEIPSRGSSTYNWRICHLDELKEIKLRVKGIIRAAIPTPSQIEEET